MTELIKFCDRKIRHHISALPESMKMIPKDMRIAIVFTHVLAATFFAIPVLIGFYVAPQWTRRIL